MAENIFEEEKKMVRGFLFSSPGKIVFEPNGIQKVADEIKALGGKKPLLVTNKGVKNSGTLKRLQDPMSAAGIPSAIFDEVEPNPSVEIVEKAFSLFKKEGCDALIGIRIFIIPPPFNEELLLLGH